MAFALVSNTPTANEHGEYIIVNFINKVKPECSLCEEKTCDEYLLYNCHCWSCHVDDYVCKKCVLTTNLYTHLCCCFRQTTHHFWYDLNKVWCEKGKKYIVLCFFNNFSFVYNVEPLQQRLC